MLERTPLASNDPHGALVRAALLEEANAALRADLLRRDELLAQREQRIRLLEEALRVLKADRWGASREKLGEAPGQGGLFNEIETLVELSRPWRRRSCRRATPPRDCSHTWSRPSTSTACRCIARSGSSPATASTCHGRPRRRG